MSRFGGFRGSFDRAAQYARACCARPLVTLLSLLKTVLVGGAVLGLVQPAMAFQIISDPGINPGSGHGVYAALLDLDKASPKSVPAARDDDALAAVDAFSALSGFAQTVAVASRSSSEKPIKPNKADDAVYSELADFAQKLGAARPVSRVTGQKVAEADNLFDALRQFNQGNGTQPTAPSPQKPGATPTIARKTAAPVDAIYVGEKVCMTCHAGHAEAFSKTLMGKIGKTQPGKFACENCHGPGSQHVKLGGGRGVGGIISFRVDDLSRTAEENNAVCLTCHEKGNRNLWQGSTHEQRGLACSNCHTIMKNVSRKSQLKTEFEPDTCYQCHKNKRAESFRTSHMPVREGKMTCTNCHNPHGSYSESLLKKATINETCYQCHAEKRGPFLWEHPPVTENCLNCHDPHGSNNDFLLKISRPRLCQQCHSGGQHNSNPRNPAVTLYAQGRECQNCHSNHHGSNNPAGARFMR
jgi:DmsE family decaheme c-type cytochrome